VFKLGTGGNRKLYDSRGKELTAFFFPDGNGSEFDAAMRKAKTVIVIVDEDYSPILTP